MNKFILNLIESQIIKQKNKSIKGFCVIYQDFGCVNILKQNFFICLTGQEYTLKKFLFLFHFISAENCYI